MLLLGSSKPSVPSPKDTRAAHVYSVRATECKRLSALSQKATLLRRHLINGKFHFKL